MMKKIDNYHLNKSILLKTMEYLSFQIIDIRDYHLDQDEYVIRFFGRTELKDTKFSDKSVCLTVKNFTPFFFIKIPDGCPRTWATGLYKYVFQTDYYKKKYPELESYKIVERNDFSGFHADEKFLFLQLIFKNAKGMKRFIYSESAGNTSFNNDIIKEKKYKNTVWNKNTFYESNIDAILKLMHIKEIRGSSWIKINVEDLDEPEELYSICDLDYECNWKNIYPDTDKNENGAYARLRILSYDIEVYSADGSFPQAYRESDKIIQIGLTYNYYQQLECYKKQIICLDTCDNLNDIEVISYKDESDILYKFIELIAEEDPDIICGYNIFGFDNKYIYDRAKLLDIDITEWSRLKDYGCNFVEKKLSSSALGDNILYFYESHGRVQIDLLKIIRRDHALENYKLDFVSSHFNSNKIISLDNNEFTTPSVSGLEKDGYFHIKLVENLSGIDETYPEKFQVISIEDNKVKFKGEINYDKNLYTLKWSMAKDDLPPQEIFNYQIKDSYHRSLIAKYCIKDCILVNFLMEKLDVLSTNFAMSNVCWVPLYYIFIRGQGIKAFSLVAQQCRKYNFLIPAIKKSDFTNQIFKTNNETKTISVDYCTYDECPTNVIPQDHRVTMKEIITTKERICLSCERLQYYTDFEGARVFEPIPGVYWEPISVLDYASLYPRSIISRNMSWETQVFDKKYDNLPEYKYYDVEYTDSRKNIIKCRYAKYKDELGIIPKILFNLLDERDATKKKMKKEKDMFKKKIYDGHQLALKITANSLYGQLGAITSPVYRKDIAACTTAIGQQMLGVAQDFMETKFVNLLKELNIDTFEKYLPENKNKEQTLNFVNEVFSKFTINPKIIYGDTDSVFTNFQLRDKDNNKQIDATSREVCIKLASLAGELVKPFLDYPHDLEYEKTFHPWIVICKKKYAGHKYEFDPNKYSMNYMGIVLKRRDNAKIVKKTCGGILNIMLTSSDTKAVIDYTNNILKDIVKEKFDINYFVTTKTLKGEYKGKKKSNSKQGKKGESGSWKWDDVETSVSHVKLCQKLKERDPGSAPQTNDRISYVQVYNPKKDLLQGDRIEEVSYVNKFGLEIDYLYYITNQLQTPVCQFLELIIENPEEKIIRPIVKLIETKYEKREYKDKVDYDKKVNKDFYAKDKKKTNELISKFKNMLHKKDNSDGFSINLG